MKPIAARPRSPWLFTLAALAVVACSGRDGAAVALPVTDENDRFVADVLDTGQHFGISGAVLDDAGTLWIVPERQRFLLPFSGSTTLRPAAPGPLPIHGIADGIDTESLALLDDGRFAFGTEGRGDRERDDIWIAERRDGEVVAVERIPIGYRELWGFIAENNRGIEGLCHAGGHLVVAVEQVRAEDDGRRAPVALIEMRSRKMRAGWLALTSDSGKISALDCRPASDGSIAVVAVERHFGVARLLRFAIPIDPEDREAALPLIEPEIVVDIAARWAEYSRDEVPNFESVVWSGGEATLLADNHYRRVTGPTIALRLRLPQSRSAQAGRE